MQRAALKEQVFTIVIIWVSSTFFAPVAQLFNQFAPKSTVNQILHIITHL